MLRAGIVNFINTAPLFEPFKESGGVEGWDIVEGSPSELNSLLRKGNLDAGLISSFAYGLNHEDYFLFSDLCISATGPVGSVFLFSRDPVDSLDGKKIYLTCQSATSINLLYVILEGFSGINPCYETGNFDAFDSDRDIRAYLAIGDEALRLRDMETGLYRYDLAEIWIRETGLPFVFAVWAIRGSSWKENAQGIRRLHDRLNLSYKKGREDIEGISRQVAGRIPMAVSDCIDYLKGIELDLSPEKEKGLMEFFRLVREIRPFPAISEIRTIC